MSNLFCRSGRSRRRLIGSIGSILLVLPMFVACGDDVTQINQTGLEVVGSTDDLPKCSAKNKGEQVLVTDDAIIRVCVDGEWLATKSGDADDFSCKTVELKDGSGLKIVCNGDSIGVVLNGSDGKDGKSGKDGKDGEDAVIPQDTLENDSERVAISLDSLVGYTQKGPFLKGSTVYLYELSDGRTLKQTNGNFTSNIASENGRYKFMARDLVSQYAMVVVDGYYRNEVTGVSSDAPIRLKAITDMRKRNSVNVNILTQLEYDRVYYLVTREQKTVKQAKRQAQREILKLFDIELNDEADAEDMDVFGKTDADAALLAISVLLQGDGSATDLSVLLTEISNAISEKGLWKDSTAKARLADWAMKADSDNRLALFRKNVRDWGLGDSTVPEFEKFVRNYIATESGLGICGGETMPFDTIVNVPNPKSEYFANSYTSAGVNDSKVRFICDGKNGDAAHWRIATELERDTKGWTKDTVKSSVRKGEVDTNLTYVFEDGWRHGTDLDRIVGIGCTQDMAVKDSVSRTMDTAWYVCEPSTETGSAWRLMTHLEMDADSLKSKKNLTPGTLLNGPFTGKSVVWDNGSLRLANDFEVMLGRGCIAEMYNHKYQLSNKLMYNCSDSGWSKKGTFTGNGITYYAVQIGSQVWMAENLKYEYTISQSANTATVYNNYCYNGDKNNCSKYGRLYFWAAAIDSAKQAKNGLTCGHLVECDLPEPVRGICPSGWHLPSKAEWDTLLVNVGGAAEAGAMLKSESDWIGNGNGTDAYSFTALPVGVKDAAMGYYMGEGSSTIFWSSTQFSYEYVYGVMLSSDKRDADVSVLGKEGAFSIRCIQD